MICSNGLIYVYQINVVLEPYSRSFYITTSIGNNFDKKFNINGLKENTWYKMVLSQRKIGVWMLDIIIKKIFLFLSFNNFPYYSNQFLMNWFLGFTLFSSTSKWRTQSRWTKPQTPKIWKCPSICICQFLLGSRCSHKKHSSKHKSWW